MSVRSIAALLLCVSLLAVACGSDETIIDATEEADQAASTTLADDEGEDVGDASDTTDSPTTAETTTQAPPTTEDANAGAQIISLSPTATEMLFAVGAGDQVIAVDEFSNHPPEAPTTDLSGFEPNVEAIAGFEPTLVLSESPIEGLDALGIENMVLAAPVTLDDIYAQIEQVGAATGHVGDAAELVSQMQTDIDAVLTELPDREAPLTYYHELDNTLYSVTSATFIGTVYELLGLQNIADPADADGSSFGYPQLSEEFIIDADPDIIFLADTLCCDQNAETVAERPGWEQMQAVQNGSVVELNDDVVSRWGPRIVDFIETAGAAVAAIETVDA